MDTPEKNIKEAIDELLVANNNCEYRSDAQKTHLQIAQTHALIAIAQSLGNIDLNTRIYAKFQRQDESTPFCMGQSDD